MLSENREKAVRILRHLDVTFKPITRNAINVICPFCDDSEAHAGIFLDNLRFSCWKCKTKGSFFDLLTELTGITFSDYRQMMADSSFEHRGESALTSINKIISHDIEVERSAEEVVWPPSGSVPISNMANDAQVIAYLKFRNVTQQFCEGQDVHIGVIGRYAGRFIIPVYYKTTIGAYQARDMTDIDEAKYLTKGDISYFLYNIDLVDVAQPVPITEGIFDCWATENATSSFSAALSDEQITLMQQMDPPYWVLCWDMGEDGSDAFWKGRIAARNLLGLFGPGKMRYSTFPAGEDPGSLGRKRMKEIIQNAVELG